jgi:ribonuclease HI
MRWLRRNLRGNPVWVRLDAAGQPAADRDGRVDVVYKLAANTKIYRASVRNLEDTGTTEEPVELEVGVAPTASGGGDRGGGARRPDGESIIIYTDGACSGNPGPMGIGVVIVDHGKRRELSEAHGVGTNQVAELKAILRALQEIPPTERARPVFVHSDSAYSIGLLTQNWKAKANVALVAELRALTARFKDLHFVKVKGHSGVPENERADVLATGAIR